MCPFPFGLLPEQFDMPEFGDVAHVRTGTGTHVDPVADLNDAEFLHGNRKEVHVGSFRWHDGVDFSSGHDVVRDLQSLSLIHI